MSGYNSTHFQPMTTEEGARDMKILQVYSSPSPGGGTVHVDDLTRALIERGHEVHVACRPNSHLYQWLQNTQATLHPLPLRNSIDLVSVMKLSALLKQGSFDLVHAHTGRDYPLCWMARPKSARLIFSRHLAKANKVNALSTRMFRSADAILTVSEQIRTTMTRAFKLSPDRVHAIPNWLDFSQYDTLPDPSAARQALGLTRRHAIAVLGGVVPIKGQAEFLEAAIRLSESRDDIDFLIVGVNEHADREYLDNLKTRAQACGLSDRVHFIDWMDDLKPLFPALSATIVPSWNDAFSIVTVQSMACGVPVVAFDAGGPAELITDGETGSLVHLNDIRKLADAIDTMLNDNDLRTRVINNARSYARHTFDRDTIISRIEAAYGIVDPTLHEV